MASVAPSDGGGGGDGEPPESAPVNHSSLDPPADPQRNGESPALLPSAGDVDMSAMGTSEIPDPPQAGCGEKRPLPSRPAPCSACGRRKMILRGIKPGPGSDGELPALPSAPSPVPGTGMELPNAGALGTKGSPSAIGLCGLCEFRKKIHLNKRLRRKSEPPASPPESFLPISSLDDMSRLVLEQKVQTRAWRGKKRPLSVEEERGYRECDVGKKLMRHKWDGLRHKWEALNWDLSPEMLGFGATAVGHDLPEMPSFSFTELMQHVKASRCDLLEKRAFGATAVGWDLPAFGATAVGWDLPAFGAATGVGDLLDMPRRGTKRPLSVEEERGYRECDVGKKLMRHKWDGLSHKWEALNWDLSPEMLGFGATAVGHDLPEMPSFSFTELIQHVKASGCDPLEKRGFGAMAVGWKLPAFGAATGVHDLQEMPRHGTKRPLSVEEERGYRECEVGKKLMRHKWDGLRHKWEALNWDLSLEMTGGWDLPAFGAATGVSDLLKMPGFGDLLEMPGLGALPGGRELLEMPGFVAATEKMMLAMRKTNAEFAPPQGAQKPSSSAAARVDALHEKLAQTTKVLTKVLHEGSVLQVATKLMRLLCPDVGSSAPTGGGLGGNDWGLVEEAIGNLVNQTGEGMQDIVNTVIPKVFSKEILYDLIMACVGRYPKLLEDDKGKLTKEKYDQYQKQLDLMVNLTTVYENDPENFSKIMKLMCKIGRCGPLPSEVTDDISPGLDPSTMEQLYTGMLERLHNVALISLKVISEKMKLCRPVPLKELPPS